MARPLTWRRTLFADDQLGSWGVSNSAGIEPGETVVRTLWSLQLWVSYGDTNTYPAGSSLVRAGIIFDKELDSADNTPVSQPNEAWMDLTTMPWRSQLAISAGVDWMIQADTGRTDRDSRVMRKNVDPVNPYAVWLAWELLPAGNMATDFSFFASGTIDVLVAAA